MLDPLGRNLKSSLSYQNLHHETAIKTQLKRYKRVVDQFLKQCQQFIKQLIERIK